MPIPWLNEEEFYDNENIVKYNAVIKKISNNNNLPFIDLLDLLKVDELDDGLHPNSEGHKKMFEKVKDFLVLNKII